jgi:hypothetical protein
VNARSAFLRVLMAAVWTLATACAASPPTARVDPQPIAYKLEDGRLTTELALDPALRAHPELRARLYDDGMSAIRAFEADAQQIRAGNDGVLPTDMELTMRWYAPVEASRLLGVKGFFWSFTGGAHENPVYDAILWDRTARREIAATDLFRADADMNTLDRALCDAINAAKAARGGDQAWDPAPYRGEEGLWSCPEAIKTPFSLAPGDTAGKAGGLVFLIGPYIVGPYAEGVYTAVVPATAVSALISPEWADQFGGEPSPEYLDNLRAEQAR